jgi:hypothetical protein
MTTTQSFFCRSLAMICFALSTSAAEAQMLTWSPAEKYDAGIQTSVAAHPSGLVLEVHRTQADEQITLWYHVGIFDGTRVAWGKSQLLPFEGTWPNVAISKEGYVIFVYSDSKFKNNSELRYAVGKIDVDGGINQSIHWPKSIFFDSGFHSSIAINDNGVILDVHESGSGGTGLYYRVGHLAFSNDGDPGISWDSGTNGIRYDDGINPHIALNNRDEAVEVHQVTGEHLLHYRRGPVNGGTIYFGGSPRYNNNSIQPAVALLDSGLVVEVHSFEDTAAIATTGILDPNNGGRIEWLHSVAISTGRSDIARYPAVATNGTYAIATWTGLRSDQDGHLYSAVALLAPQEVDQSELFESQAAFQSQWKLPVRVRPGRTHGNVKDRSPAPRKTVQLKSDASRSASPAGTHANAKERSSAPQKAVQAKSESPRSANSAGIHANVKERSPAPQNADQSKSESPRSAGAGKTREKPKESRKGRGTAP